MPETSYQKIKLKPPFVNSAVIDRISLGLYDVNLISVDVKPLANHAKNRIKVHKKIILKKRCCLSKDKLIKNIPLY
jgi:hypothetical protein